MTGGCSAKKNMTFRKYDENILVMEEKKKGMKQKLVIECSIRDIKQLPGLTGDTNFSCADVFMSLKFLINTAR